MCPSYVRIRLPLAEAMARFGGWIGVPELEPARRIKARDAVDVACDAGGDWRGAAVFVHEAGGWTVVDDLSGELAAIPAARWAELAAGDELVFAGYNDAIPYGQLIVVRGGRVVREFLEDLQEPDENVNRGRLDEEKGAPIDDWVAAASFVDGDDLADAGADEGWLWVFQQTA